MHRSQSILSFHALQLGQKKVYFPKFGILFAIKGGCNYCSAITQWHLHDDSVYKELFYTCCNTTKK